MPRKPTETIVTNLRLKEALRRTLAREAEKNQISLNAEMVRRLESSLEAEDKLELFALRQSMEAAWVRFEKRFLTLELEQAILGALERREFETARDLAIALRRNQEATARKQAARMLDHAEYVAIAPPKHRNTETP
jgi:hypothetical protein